MLASLRIFLSADPIEIAIRISICPAIAECAIPPRSTDANATWAKCTQASSTDASRDVRSVSPAQALCFWQHKYTWTRVLID
ncbi:MAG: hypothetical protein D6753_03315 [Planctomycetota bacterium]|nr:MAG: hypothetical protein D6753_03315 [Planctomycetota bacterium]